MWFPELFKRTALSGGSVCEAPVTTNHTVPHTDCNNDSLSSEIYFESFITAAANMPGNIFTILLIDKLGRKALLGEMNICKNLNALNKVHLDVHITE